MVVGSTGLDEAKQETRQGGFMRRIENYIVIGGGGTAFMEQVRVKLQEGYIPSGGLSTQLLPGSVQGSMELHFFQAFILEGRVAHNVLNWPSRDHSALSPGPMLNDSSTGSLLGGPQPEAKKDV